MPIHIVHNDITTMHVDAIVNAANSSLLGGGGVDGCIHRAAGSELLAECRKLGGCATGEAKLTLGYRLPCKYVIHTVGPVWRGGGFGERESLFSCYISSLELAQSHGCESVAFPLISSGIFGYPAGQAFEVAFEAVSRFLADSDMTVYIVIFNKDSFRLEQRLYDDIAQYIDSHIADQSLRDDSLEEPFAFCEPTAAFSYDSTDASDSAADLSECSPYPCESYGDIMPEAAESPRLSAMSLVDVLRQMDESFSQMLLRKIDERGMTDAQCYKKANIDRKLFSKIRSDVHYRPSKATALAFAIALELSLEETGELLLKAGYALSRSSKFDIIIEYFISGGNYDIFEINEALFAFDQSLLGAVS